MTWPTSTLSDEEHFIWLNGLWKGKRPPFRKAVVVRNTNFLNDGRLDLRDVAVLDVDPHQLASRTLQAGDIIVERSGGGPKQPVGRVAYFEHHGPLPYSFSNFTSVLRVRSDSGLLPRFVHYYLLHLYRSGFTVGLQRATTGLRNLDFTAYKEAPIPLPPEDEQEAIARLLDRAQDAASTEERLIAATRELKQAAMQHLFTRGLRGEERKETEVGLAPKTWQSIAIGDLGDIVTGTTPKTGERRYYDGGTVPFIAPGDLGVTTGIARTEKTITEAGLAVCRPLPRGSVCFVCIGSSIGKVGMTVGDRSATNQQINAVVANEGHDPRFVCYLLTYLSGYIASFTSPSPVPILSKGVFARIPIVVPSDKAEESAIADIVEAIDRKLELHQRREALVRELFDRLLHDLMTGRRRVPDRAPAEAARVG
jgi:type I restriction enzyme, S subunit